jgi:RNA recognition motif-containing protein
MSEPAFDPVNPNAITTPSSPISPSSPTELETNLGHSNEINRKAMVFYHSIQLINIAASIPVSHGNAPDPDDKKLFSLYIGNLPPTVDEDALRNLFSQYNPGEVRVKQDTSYVLILLL